MAISALRILFWSSCRLAFPLRFMNLTTNGVTNKLQLLTTRSVRVENLISGNGLITRLVKFPEKYVAIIGQILIQVVRSQERCNALQETDEPHDINSDKANRKVDESVGPDIFFTKVLPKFKRISSSTKSVCLLYF